MKKAELRTEVETALRSIGFKAKQFRWHGCTLDLVVGGEFRSIRFPAGMSKRAMSFELGRIVGWVEILTERASTQAELARAGMAAAVAAHPKPIKTNGHAAPAGVSP